MRSFFRSLRVGFFLSVRNIKRASLWTTFLIVSVMCLTFLNLVVVTGILVGLIEGSVFAYKQQYSGDVIVSKLPTKNFILESNELMSYVKSMRDVKAYTTRYLSSGTLEANYKTKSDFTDLTEFTSATVVGIDPYREDEVTNLSSYLIEGNYLNPKDDAKILIGSGLLANYARGNQPGFTTLKDVGVGSKLRLRMGEILKEVEVKGIVKSKVSSVNRRVFFVDRELRTMLKRSDYNLGEVVLRLKDGVDETAVTQRLKDRGFGENAQVQTSREAQGEFIEDISTTFQVLGDMIGSISLLVASITIFIVIFINAITKQKYIGILKGIGISAKAIEFSYILMAVFYALIGSGMGLFLLYFFIKPYFDANPIDFPFSDGILAVTVEGTLLRILVLIVTTIIAGYFPARMIIKKKTLDAILGR